MSIILHESLVIPGGMTAKKFQNVSDSLSSYQVVVNEATDIVEETKTPAGQEATAVFFALEFASTTRAVSAQSLPAPKSTIETFPVAQTDWTPVRQ